MKQNRNIMIWYAILLHYAWAYCLWFEQSVKGVTAISELTNLGILNYFPLSPSKTVSVLMFLAATGAFVSLWLPREFWKVKLGLLLSQQALLVTSAGGALGAMVASCYADGVIRPRLFVIADQLPTIIVAILHALAVLYEVYILDKMLWTFGEWKLVYKVRRLFS